MSSWQKSVLVETHIAIWSLLTDVYLLKSGSEFGSLQGEQNHEWRFPALTRCAQSSLG